MKKILKHSPVLLTLLLLVIVIANNSCYYDSEEFLFPELPELCDTSDISFTETIYPILYHNCLPCHGNDVAASLGSNIRLENYDDLVLRAQDGSLIGAITHSNGYTPMPKDAAQLSDCNIKRIKKWIEDGSINN